MRLGDRVAFGDGAIIGILQILLLERSDFSADGTCRRCGQSIRRDAAHGRPPASRRTVARAVFAGIPLRAVPDASG
jgi:hypothetical protein